MKNWVGIVLVLLAVASCRMRDEKELAAKKESNDFVEEVKDTTTNHLLLPLMKNGNYTAVVEIPAGTNHKIEYHKTNHEFVCDQKEGKDRIVKFLGYPGNYGFIPSTMMDKDRGGDGDALDVLILSEHVAIGTYMEIIPVGIMYLLDGGEEDHKLLAVPADDQLNTLHAKDLSDIDQPVLHIISEWFANYKGPGEMEFKGFADKAAAIEEIKKWSLNNSRSGL